MVILFKIQVKARKYNIFRVLISSIYKSDFMLKIKLKPPCLILGLFQYLTADKNYLKLDKICLNLQVNN